MGNCAFVAFVAIIVEFSSEGLGQMCQSGAVKDRAEFCTILVHAESFGVSGVSLEILRGPKS